MKEPLRRKNLHSIISKISGNVEASQQSEEELTVNCEEQTTGDEKTDSNLKIADEQPTSLNMFPKEADVMITTKANEVIHQADPKLADHHAGPYSCQLCHIGFLTRHELQLHVMCHGIYISDDTSNPGGRNMKSTTQVTVSRGELDKNVGPEAGEMPCRKSPVIQNPNDIPPRAESIGSSKKDQSVPHSYDIAASPTSDATSLEEQEKLAANETQNGLHPPLSDSGSSEASYGRIVDVLSLATATTGFKQPGSIWCSLCKCTVERGHICKVHQTSYHADKTEEGFTCELCGRYYNQKRKLRTHLRNRHKGFRLQEDEGYMCWQCWQAFPEIKILEEHIVTVHGHESRRQNSTWRPFTMTPSTLPSSGDTCEEPTPLPTGIGPPIPSALSPTDQQTTNLKRPGDTIPDRCPIKKTPREGVPVQEVLNVGEVNGKVVVNDIFTVSPEVPLCPQTTGASGASHSSITATTQPTAEVFELGALQSQPASVPVVTPSENSWNKQSYTSHGGNVRGDAKDDVSVSNLRIIPGATASNVQSSNMNFPSSKKKNPSQCPHCPKKFAKKHMLHLHIQQNHGENMHCFFCSTSCGTREALASHIRSTHQGEVMNGKCPICQCKCLGELAQHIVQYHYKDLLTRKDKDRVLSTCPICNQTTTDTYHLRWHILKEHRGLQVSVDYLEGSTGETSSEGGSPVTSEGRMGYEGPDRIMGVPRGSSSLAEGNSAEGNPAEESENVRVKKEPDVDEVEIVFVSDKNIDSDWSKPRQEKTHRSESGSTAGCMTTVETPTVSVDSVKKPADSSVSSNSSSKLGQTRVAADQVHSTTGLEETKTIDTSPADPQYPISTSKSNYVRVSEEACIFCFNSFPDKETLVSHLRSAHGWVDTFNCPICSYRGGTYLNVVEHFCVSHFYPIEETETQSEVKCLKCDILFPDIAHLKKHVSALHSFQIPAEPKYDTFKCRHCNIIFEKQFDAQKHFDVYHLFRIRYKCESCRMGFTAKHDFQEHVTCNHPELVKSFCPVCGLGFEVNADLEEHVFEMHRRKAQFYCAQCGNEFADRFHVHMHIRSNCCVKWADSNFECLDCLTAFSSISELRIHCNQRSCKLNSKK